MDTISGKRSFETSWRSQNVSLTLGTRGVTRRDCLEDDLGFGFVDAGTEAVGLESVVEGEQAAADSPKGHARTEVERVEGKRGDAELADLRDIVVIGAPVAEDLPSDTEGSRRNRDDLASFDLP